MGCRSSYGTGVTSFGAGNIILGGDGSDIIEGRGGDDLIDGDLALNVRISVRSTVDADGNGIADRNASGELVLGPEIFSVDSMTELTSAVFAGQINPGQLSIVREILPLAGGPDFDTAVYSDVLANYLINGQPFNPASPPRPMSTGSTRLRTLSAALPVRTAPIGCRTSRGCSSPISRSSSEA